MIKEIKAFYSKINDFTKKESFGQAIVVLYGLIIFSGLMEYVGDSAKKWIMPIGLIENSSLQKWWLSLTDGIIYFEIINVFLYIAIVLIGLILTFAIMLSFSYIFGSIFRIFLNLFLIIIIPTVVFLVEPIIKTLEKPWSIGISFGSFLFITIPLMMYLGEMNILPQLNDDMIKFNLGNEVFSAYLAFGLVIGFVFLVFYLLSIISIIPYVFGYNIKNLFNK